MGEQSRKSGDGLKEYVAHTLQRASRIIENSNQRKQAMEDLLRSIDADPAISEYLFKGSRLSRETKSQAEQELLNHSLIRQNRQQHSTAHQNQPLSEGESVRQRIPVMMRGLNI